MRIPGLTLLAVGAGCAEPPVELQGVVRDGLGGAGLPEVSATSLDDTFTEVDQTTTDSFGWYRLSVPAGGQVHVLLEGPELISSSFSGQAGFNPRLRVPTGSSVAFTNARWSTLLDQWDGCPGLGEQGTILGSIQIADVAEETGEPIPVRTGRVTLELADGSLRAACYLGDEDVYDAEASQTGDTTRFVIGNVPPGVHLVRVAWQPAPGVTLDQDYVVWVPEDGIAPRFPLLVEPPVSLDL